MNNNSCIYLNDKLKQNLFFRFKWLFFSLFVFLFSCEKKITIDLPKSEPSLVVEACINDRFPTLNYVFISQTVDYFNPDLSVLGITGAEVYITEGTIAGTDTLFDTKRRILLADRQFPESPAGFYYNPGLFPKQGFVYKLEIFYQNKTVLGYTQIPIKTVIDRDEVRFDGERDGKRKAFPSVYFFDPPEASYYRFVYTINRDSLLLGFGASDRIRLLNDELINNKTREFNNYQPLSEGDTISNYLCRLGRKEFLFWQSFAEAQNNDGPFATPVQLRSTLDGAIGCFTGYSIDYKKSILLPK